MTLPDERWRAVKNTRQFLCDLLNSRIMPRVPLHIRREARALLKHYPSDHDADTAFVALKGLRS